MILTLVACGSKPSDNNNNTDSTAFPTKTMTIVCPYGAGGGSVNTPISLSPLIKAESNASQGRPVSDKVCIS